LCPTFVDKNLKKKRENLPQIARLLPLLPLLPII